jgi:putative ABC transport system substrate-binding protein
LEAVLTAPRLVVIVGLFLAPLGAPLVASAQPPGKVYRVGLLCGTSCATPTEDAFRERLRQLGWVEGRTVTIEARAAAGRYEELPRLAAELVRLNVDVLVAGGYPAIVPASRATTSIPVVFCCPSDPVKLGIVQSLARPGTNVTGFTYAPSWEFIPKLLELLREAVPTLRRVGVISDVPEDPPPWWSRLEEAARTLGLQVIPAVPVRGPDTFNAAVARLAQMQVDGVIVTMASTTGTYPGPLAAELQRVRIASIGIGRELPQAGGFMSYGVNFRAIFMQMAEYVDRILRGTKPADLPVQQPTTFELVVNLKTAKALGLAIPSTVLARADQIVE